MSEEVRLVLDKAMQLQAEEISKLQKRVWNLEVALLDKKDKEFRECGCE